MRLNQLARDLWMYIEPYIDRKLRHLTGGGGGGGGGSTGGAPSPHALSGSHHSGTLADSQAPQFLKTDGSRTLTGDLVVDGGVTLDGVDLSAHAADPDAHHSRATAGNTGVSVSAGQAVSVALRTMSGLLVSSGLGVGEGDGIDVLTNSVAVDVTDIIDTTKGITEASNNIQVKLETHAGLEFGASGGVEMGTPTSLSVSSTNLVNSSTHSHAVTASSDVGTTPAARLLKSTAAGGLILGSLGVKGAADIDQGLTAAGTGFRVIYHTHDYDHAHVVINPGGAWTLDEQFGLDIDDNLLVRGWIVGKHAIQLAGAQMLVHYDGPLPPETNYKGNPTGHMGQVATVYGNPVYTHGRFGKAIQLAQATTNLITNPSFEVNLTGWADYATGSADGNRLRMTDQSFVGSASLRLRKFAGAAGDNYGVRTASMGPFTNGTTYTLSAWVYIETLSDTVNGCVTLLADGAFVGNSVSLSGLTDGWQRVSMTMTASSTATAFFYLYLDNTLAGIAYIDAVQLEQKDHATPYCDGSLGDGHSWSGTAHASSSSRASASRLTYETAGNVNPVKGTVMAWVRGASVNGHVIAFLDSGSNINAPRLYVTTGNLPRWWFEGGAKITSDTALDPTAWSHIAVTWDFVTNSHALYVNGVSVGTYTVSHVAPTFASVITVGAYYNGAGNGELDGELDELSILDRVLTGDEIRAVYESNAPIFAETSTWHWRAGRNRIYADAEGLWGYGANSGAILGLYAGDEDNPSATKSWGGQNLSEGDLLIGRYGASNGGWLWFDQDLVGGQPGLIWGYADKEVFRFDSGGASLYGVLDIDTSGGIYQGSGTFASPTTGLKVWSDLIPSGGGARAGRIAGYNGGTLQWEGNTSGKLTAGAGAVIMDATGIHGYNGGTLQWGAGTDGKIKAAGGKVELGADGLIIKTSSVSYLGEEAVTWLNTSDAYLGSISTKTGSGGSMYLHANSSVRIGSIPGGVGTEHYLQVGPSGGSSFRNGNVLISEGSLFVTQEDAAGAAPALFLRQQDLSEEFIQFSGTLASGNPVNQDSAGAYWGKVRVSVNGTFRWIHLYS